MYILYMLYNMYAVHQPMYVIQCIWAEEQLLLTISIKFYAYTHIHTMTSNNMYSLMYVYIHTTAHVYVAK